MDTALLFYGFLRDADQLADIGGRCAAEVDHDVRVDMGDLRAANAISLESALIDEPSSADAFDLFEDRSRARMPVEPRMLSAAPAQVLLQHTVECCLIASRELERC